MTDSRGVALKFEIGDAIKMSGIVVSIITAVIIPFAIWMTTIHGDVRELKRDVAEVKARINSFSKVANK